MSARVGTIRDVKRALSLIESAGGSVEWEQHKPPEFVKAKCPDGHEVFAAMKKDSKYWICRYINVAGSTLRWG